MKNFHPIAALAVVGILAFASCSKKSGQGSTQPKQSCQLMGVTNVIGGGTPSNFSFTYNENGQRSIVQISSAGYPTTLRVFTYSGNMIYVQETEGGAVITTDTVTLNASGQIVTDLNTNLQYGSRQFTTYSFSGTEIKQAVTDFGSGQQTTSNYVWSGGNLVAITGEYVGIPDTVTYTYDNAPAQTADYWSFYQLVAYPDVYIKTANRVVSESNGTIATVSYSTDSLGNISKMMENYSGTVETDTYQWTCH